MIRYTKEYISQLLERFMNGETTVPEEDVLNEYFRTTRNVPEEWKDYQTMFAGWIPSSTRRGRRYWHWAALAAAAIALVLLVSVTQKTEETRQVVQTVIEPEDSTAVQPMMMPDTVAVPAVKPETPKRPKRPIRVNDAARDYVLMAEAEQKRVLQEIAEAKAEVERVQLEVLDAQLRAEGYVSIKYEDGTIEYIKENEKSEYYAYEPD